MVLTDNVYKASNGETFDQIAMRLWDDEKYAADLLCANPEHCGTMVFYGGEILRIPWVDLPTGDENTVAEPAKAPWKE